MDAFGLLIAAAPRWVIPCHNQVTFQRQGFLGTLVFCSSSLELKQDHILLYLFEACENKPNDVCAAEATAADYCCDVSVADRGHVFCYIQTLIFVLQRCPSWHCPKPVML
jgi:hypothetical protein